MSQQINLFNPVFLKQKKYFSAVAMVQALVLVALGAFLLYGYMRHEVSGLVARLDEITKRRAAEEAKLASQMDEFSPERSAEALKAEVTRLEAQLAAQEKLLATVKSGAIGNTSGYSEYLRAFARQSFDGLWLTGFDIVGDGTEMSLSGGVLKPQFVATYIRRLSHERVMKGKEFATMQMREPESETKRRVKRYVAFVVRSTVAKEEKQ